jgi:hypothetical protein
MNWLIGRTLASSVILFTSSLWILSLGMPSPAQTGDGANDLVAIGRPGPEAIKFKTWTNKQEGEVFHPEDRIIIFLNAERQAYVTILALSSDGNIRVVLPNRLMKDNLIEPNKLYALFGDDAPVRMTAEERSGSETLLMYLSSSPFALDPLKIATNEGWLTIRRDSLNEIQILKEKIQTMSNDREFNTATLLLPYERSEGLKIRLTEVPQSGVRRALPGGIESSEPEVLTGSSGLKPLRKGKLKE